MSSSKREGIADIGDRHRRRGATSMLLLGLAFAALGARQWVVPGTTERMVLGLGVLALIVAAFGFLLPIFLWKARNLWSRDSASCRLYRGEDGVVAESLSRAHIISWIATAAFLGLFSGWDSLLAIAPPRFLINLTMAVLFGSFGAAFLILDGNVGEGDGWEPELDG